MFRLNRLMSLCVLAALVAGSAPAQDMQSSLPSSQVSTAAGYQVHVLAGEVNGKKRFITVLGEDRSLPAPVSHKISSEELVKRSVNDTLSSLGLRVERPVEKNREDKLSVSAFGFRFKFDGFKAPQKQSENTIADQDVAELLRSLDESQSFSPIEKDQLSVTLNGHTESASHLRDLATQLERGASQVQSPAKEQKPETFVRKHMGKVVWTSMRAVDAAATAWDVCQIATHVVTGDLASAAYHAGIFAASSGSRTGFIEVAWPWVRAKCPFVDKMTHQAQYYITARGEHKSITKSAMETFQGSDQVESLVLLLDERYADKLLSQFEKQHGFKRLPIKASVIKDN